MRLDTDDTPKPISDYIERVEGLLPDGQTIRKASFRKFVIESTGERAYGGKIRREIGRITIEADRTVTVKVPKGFSEEDLKPTPEEAAAIAEVPLPTSIPATAVDARDKARELGGQVFIFRNADGKVPFIQHRVINDEGKNDYPWSKWSDGPWRPMEPDGLLPLFGLDALANSSILPVMIHEGAKTASFLQELLADTKDAKKKLAAHPWGQELQNYVHLGWPGGAPNPHRVDWEPIRQLSPDRRVVVVADRDDIGEKAVSKISEILKRQMSVLRFGHDFPSGHDLSDAFPAKMFEANRYTGPSLTDCLGPATWATKVVPQTDSSKRGPKKIELTLTDPFIAERFYSVKPATFVHRNNPRWRYDEKEFNAKVAPFSQAKNTAELLKRELSAQADGLAYEPGRESGQIVLESRQVINVHRGSGIKPVAGDATPFLDFMIHLIPNESERAEVLRWIATLLARPDIRMRYGLLLISEMQGVGKSTLFDILAELIGVDNCSFPSPSEVTKSDFSAWKALKRLVIINEIYEGENWTAYNRLKAVITDERVSINEKHEKEYTIRNWLHVCASSNTRRALKLDSKDRRWLVPEVTEEKRPREYWKVFHAWLKFGGREIILHWAQEHVKTPGNVVETNEEAPATEAKRKSVLATMSDAERRVADLVAHWKEVAPNKVMRTDEIRTWVINYLYNQCPSLSLRPPSTETIADYLRRQGLKIHKARFQADKQRFWVVYYEPEIDEDATWAELKQERYIHPETLWAIEDRWDNVSSFERRERERF